MYFQALFYLTANVIVSTAYASFIPSSGDLLPRGSPSGINNRGSLYCAGEEGAMQQLKDIMSQISNEQHYNDGFHIACTKGHICTFLQNTGVGASGYQVKILINALAEHENTEACGSIPLSYPVEFGGKNELSFRGMLTANYVKETANPCTAGELCEGQPTGCNNS